MKYIILILFIILGQSAFAQNISADSLSAAQVEELMRKMQQTMDSAQTTYALAQEHMRHSQELDNRFFSWVWGFTTLVLGILAFTGGSIFLFYKELKKKAEEQINNFKDKAHLDIDEIKKENKEHITRIAETEAWSVNLRRTKKIVVINKNLTGTSPGFDKVIKHFSKTSEIKVDKLDEIKDRVISTNADVIILENADAHGSWNINDEGNEDILIDLANTICPQTGILYYGKGRFPDDKVEPAKSYMVSFANSPAQLYGNLMNLLKFKYVLEDVELERQK